MNNICVFCGSNIGLKNEFTEQAKALSRLIVKNDQTLIYGGGSVGLMGVIADEVMSLGGTVIGVIPEFLVDKEVHHQKLTEMFIVKTMHERKQKMAELSDAFVAMPGGFGTLDELAETLTWVQLGILSKPAGLLNVGGFYDPLVRMFDQMVESGFLSKKNRNILQVNADPGILLSSMQENIPDYGDKWLDNSRI